MAFGKTYCFGPCFRAEKSKTRKHLTEFWMVEPEMAFYDLKDNMDLIEEFIVHIVSQSIENCKEELKILERDITLLEKVKSPFPRITYDEAVKILHDNGQEFKYGRDFVAPDVELIA